MRATPPDQGTTTLFPEMRLDRLRRQVMSNEEAEEFARVIEVLVDNAKHTHANLDFCIALRSRYENALNRIAHRDVTAKKPHDRAWDYEQIAADALLGNDPS